MTVYFIQSPRGPIKIGTAKSVTDRFHIIQGNHFETLSCLGIITEEHTGPSRSPIEKEIHGIFSAHRVRGEWFAPVPELLEYIAKHATPFPYVPGKAGRQKKRLDKSDVPAEVRRFMQ